ncbi:DUF4160 domain-containing protein [Oleomonas cavernae]|uniref:DUF4160 domain-containing protein n=1 Tax=Oleomonas cavernae TaxID=2320859 RepID=A0A418WGN1_9PROT|nr:DUF4160 domain-containing protein [Oleomonas cavernae]RJF89132.1 DUF4160 domain-containing protein [Oleomonas cavernae]
MVTMHRQGAWKIAVYGNEHGIPHFHIEGRDFRASVNIATLELIIGTVSGEILREATVWARQNREALLAKWQELNG